MLSSRSSHTDVIALLDIGSSKVACAIAQLKRDKNGANGIHILGFGQRRANGVRAGMIVDLDRAEAGVRGAISDAEADAGLTVKELTVALSSGRLHSNHFNARLELEAGHVRSNDLQRLALRARQYAERDGRALVYLNRIHYALDGETGIRAPKGMHGKRLTCQFHAVTGEMTLLNNLECLIERCYLKVRNFVPTGFASAIAATTPDEQRIGVTCIDIGAGAAKITVIVDGRFIYTDTVVTGGAILTHDIARIFSISLAEAERLKTLYGALINLRHDRPGGVPYWDANVDRLVTYRALQGEIQETTVAELSHILYNRTRRQLEFIKERLDKSSLTRELAQSVVLTGGGSQLTGLSNLATEVLGRPVRIGAANNCAGLAPEYQGPALSTVVGLGLIHKAPAELVHASGVRKRTDETYMSRMEQWLRESF